ncbi:MAG: hypothetical protein ACP5QR_11565 [Rhizomicrobium sp.]
MGILHFPEWLKVLLITWGVVSLLAAPLVGFYLKGARLEKSPDHSLPSQNASNLAPHFASDGAPLLEVQEESMTSPKCAAELNVGDEP